MAKTEIDIKQQYEDDYNEAIEYWNPTYREMQRDLKDYLGDQWSAEDKAYLQEEGRSAFVYNYQQRNVHLNSGLQRASRLGFGVDPQEPNDSEYSDYCQDGLIWQANKCNFYNKQSDAFEDASITGMSIISFGLDFSRDYVNGRVICDVDNFQSIIIDPLFTKIDLSDCRYIIKRQYISRDKAKSLLPTAKNKIDDLKAGI